MSSTATPKPYRPRRATAAGRAATGGSDLLGSAGTGTARAAGLLCDLHGGALVKLARAIAGDPVRAEAAVVDVIARACADADALRSGSRGLRRELARSVYHHAVGSIADMRPPVPGSALDKMAHVTRLACQQRAAVALVQYGDHTADDVAELLRLPIQIVALLLCSGLEELEAADRRDTVADGVRQAGRGR